MPMRNSIDFATDMYEDNGNLIVQVSLPGMLSDNVDITIENQRLRVSAHREDEKEVGDATYFKKEIQRGDFERVIDLPYEVDESKAHATFQDGILKIALPKRQGAQGRKISIS